MKGTLHMEHFSAQSQTVTLTQDEGEGVSLQVKQTVAPEQDGTQEAEQEEESTVNGDTNVDESNTVGKTYQASDGTFSTDENGNTIYTDAVGNVTSYTDQYNYTDENGNIISDGYGYIDPYTGAYIQ